MTLASAVTMVPTAPACVLAARCLPLRLRRCARPRKVRDRTATQRAASELVCCRPQFACVHGLYVCGLQPESAGCWLLASQVTRLSLRVLPIRAPADASEATPSPKSPPAERTIRRP